MILQCRIHRSRDRVGPLPFALVFAFSLFAPLTEIMGQYAAGSTSEEAGPVFLPTVPLQITAGVDIGYDDNVRTSGAGGAGGASAGESLFARENLVLSYNRHTDRSEVNLLAVGRFSQFLDLGTDDKDGNVTLSLAHNVSTRLSIIADVYVAYQTEPDFGANVGLENVRADHFYTSDIFAVTYRWLPRLATVTSYTFQRVKYAETTSDTASQDRLVNTVAEELQFSLTRRTNLIGQYRFEMVDYDTAPRDSTTHFALVGIGHNLTEHLAVSVLGGESFRSFKDEGDTINPYVEGKIGYQSSNHSLNWTTSYRVEEPSAQQALVRTTIRTGLNLMYDLTSRIESKAIVYYHHDENEGATLRSIGSQDALHLTLGLKYTINKHFVLHVDYEHTVVSSLGTQAGYSRNRYFGGLTYTY
jgi:Putative beta-barrel porin 2